MPRSAEHPAVIALGSPHGDDQIAWTIADRLSADPAFHGSCTRVTSPWDVIPHIPTDRPTIIIDACRSGAPAGTIHRVMAQELPDQPGMSASTHGSTLEDALGLAESLGYDLSQVAIYAIEMEACQPGAPVSEAARRAAEQLAVRIRDELADGEKSR
jgi:hydrogenase maturation protease